MLSSRASSPDVSLGGVGRHCGSYRSRSLAAASPTNAGARQQAMRLGGRHSGVSPVVLAELVQSQAESTHAIERLSVEMASVREMVETSHADMALVKEMLQRLEATRASQVATSTLSA